MSLLEKMKPKFWEFRENTDDPSNFRHIWLLMVLLTLLVAIAPLVSMTMIDNNAQSRAQVCCL